MGAFDIPWSRHGPLAPSRTIAEAREYIEDHIDDGAVCPCCGSYLKMYRRVLNRAKTRELQSLYVWADDNDSLFDYFHVPTTGVSLRNREYPKLRWWHFLESRDSEIGSGEGTGWWRLTPQGIAFVRGELRVPNRVFEFRSQVLGFDPESDIINLRDALADTSTDPED